MNSKFFSSVRIAFRALRVNLLRSGLTMLGIIIGVAAVIAMVAIGAGATTSIANTISSIGSNLIVVVPGSVTSGGLHMGMGNSATLTEDDAAAMQRECPAVLAVSPTLRGSAQVVFGNNNWSTAIQGVTPDFMLIRDLTMAQGVAFTQQEVHASSKVVLLGLTVVKNLFGGIDPVGRTVRINRVPFIVIGVLASKGGSTMGDDQDDTILMPITTAKKRVLGNRSANASSVGQVLVKARNSDRLDEAVEQIKLLLRQRHHVQLGQEDDFQVRNLQEVFGALKNAALIASLLLASIASISLFVGGIGIMNTMLISVTERTREIGLRQAVGAKTRDILWQFLIESVVLSLLGGAIGIVVGIGISAIVSIFAPWDTVIYPSAVLLAFTFSAMVGIFFGFYPARKAAYMDPIEALRYE